MTASLLDFAAVREALLELRIPHAAPDAGELPRPEVEWPILVTFDAPVESARCFELFDADWRERNDTLIYGLSPEGGWQRCAGDAGGAFQAIQVAARLPGDAEPRSLGSLEQLLGEVTERAASLGALLTEARYPLESAVARAAELDRLRSFFEARAEGCVHVRVVGDAGLRSSEVSGLLADVGFDARPGGLFCLSNPGGYVGHDPILAALLERETELLLWFAVPRVADPIRVLDAMVAVAALVATVLGGRIVDEQGAPLDSLAMRRGVDDLVERMTRANLIPGETGLALV